MNTFNNLRVPSSDRSQSRSVSPRHDAAPLRTCRQYLSGALAIALLAVAAAWRPAAAQAYDAAHQTIHIGTFGMATYYKPNFFDTGSTAKGITGGASADWAFGILRPGIEVRGSYTTYDYMNQKLFAAGPHLGVKFGRFNPYGDFLIGYGVATFNHPASPTYLGNDSTVTSIGGGLDYAIARYWAVRVDYQREKWDFDAPKAPFTPQSISLGVHYLVHSRSRGGPE